MPNDVINTITLGNITYDIGGSGHTIEKSDGTDMTQRANLQFVDATVTDDSTNDRTKIENVKTITNESELDDLPDGIYIGPTDEGLPFDAGDIPYDNTESGLSADKVQDAIDELDDVITTDETTIEGNPINFSTLSAQNAESTIIDLDPIQDLHGYDKPWVGGAGKNLLPMTVENIKSANTAGTWSGNVYSLNNGIFTILTDSDNNVIGIKTNGTFSANTDFTVYVNQSLPEWLIAGTNYILNGCPANGSAETFRLYANYFYNGSNHVKNDVGNGVTCDWNNTSTTNITISFLIRFISGYNSQNQLWYPMLRLSTESDATFQPYTNECGISGRSEIGILGCGKNLFTNENWSTLRHGGGLTITKVNDSCYAINGTSSANPYWITMNNSEKLPISLPYGTYTFSVKDSNGNLAPLQLYISSSPSYGRKITYTGEIDYVRILPHNSQTFSGNYYFQIEKNSDTTDYSPYTKSNDLTISLGQTVYGGTLDVENGVLTVNKRMQNLGDLTWSYSSSSSFFVSEEIIDTKKYTYLEVANALCDCYAVVARSYISSYNAVLAMYNSGNIYYLCIKDTTKETDATAFKTAMNGVRLVYELATPITIQLTPNEISLLEGVNNISTIGDKITLTYRDGKVATLKDIKDTLESSKPVYSTVETVVGTYLNKPLYSKTYQIQFSSSNSYYFDVPSTMDIKFVFGGVYSTRFDFIPFGYGGSGGDMVQCYRFSDTQFRIQNAYYASRMYCDVTLQYTKSTD